MNKWFYDKAGIPTGPFSESEIRDLYEASVLRPHTRIRREGATTWIELEKAGLDLSGASHTGKPGTAPGIPKRRPDLQKMFPPPADGHGPHFTSHGGRIEFHSPCRARKTDCIKVVAMGLLLAVAALAVYLWLSA